MNGPDREVVGVPLQVGDRFLTVTAVSVGNPHCVVFTDALDDDEVRQLGPKIETHASFPNRTNVQFARVLARDRVEIRIWERGAGYTLASGLVLLRRRRRGGPQRTRPRPHHHPESRRGARRGSPR